MNIGRDPISGIQDRIQQIEQSFNPSARPQPAQSFRETLTGLQNQGTMRIDQQYGMQNMMPGTNMMQPVNSYSYNMPGMNMMQPVMNPYGMPGNNNPNIRPLAQSNGVSCGQTSVAMCINSLTGKNLTDMDINAKYGFQLLNALNSETGSAGVNWRDGGNISPYSWGLIDQKVNNEGMPVIVALNGPEFSPSGRGHIVTIVKTQGNTVYFADPANGQIRTTTKEAMNNAQKHPDGNFVFFPVKGAPPNQFMAPA